VLKHTYPRQEPSRTNGVVPEDEDFSPERKAKVPSALNPQPLSLNPQPSTLITQPSTPNPYPSTLNPQPSTPNPQPWFDAGAKQLEECYACANTCAGRDPPMPEQATASVGTSPEP